MKKIYARFPVALFFLPVCLNPLFAQVRYGLKVGVALSDMPVNTPYTLYYSNAILQNDVQPQLNFLAGGVAEYDLRRNWTLSAELQLSTRGYREKAIDPNQQDFSGYSARLWYLQLPLSFNFRWNGLFAGAGPYLGVALAGRTKTTIADGTSNTETVYKSGARFGNGEEDSFRRVDGGAYAQAGYSFRNFRLSFAALFGLTNAIPGFYSDSSMEKARQQVFSIAAAYYFGLGE